MGGGGGGQFDGATRQLIETPLDGYPFPDTLVMAIGVNKDAMLTDALHLMGKQVCEGVGMATILTTQTPVPRPRKAGAVRGATHGALEAGGGGVAVVGAEVAGAGLDEVGLEDGAVRHRVVDLVPVTRCNHHPMPITIISTGRMGTGSDGSVQSRAFP